MQPTASRPIDPASSWPWRLALAGLLAIAAFLRLYHLETPSMWWDEVITASDHGTATFAATDIRPMALFIRRLQLVAP